MKQAFVLVSMWLFAGCTPSYVQEVLPINHPANPEASQAEFENPPESLTARTSDDLRGLDSVEQGPGMEGMHNMEGMPGMNMKEKPGMEGMHNMEGMPGMNMKEEPEMEGMHNMEGMNHGGQSVGVAASLPEGASEYLTQLMSAYLAIGDMLASDMIDGLGKNVERINSAVHALDEIEFDENSEIWSLDENESREIRQHAQELELATDLSSARSAFRPMSVTMARVYSETGVPGSYNAPVNRFVCGASGEKSEVDIWLQLGDVVRNPYRGNHTSSCRTEFTPVPKFRVDPEHNNVPDSNENDLPERKQGQGGLR